MLPRGWNTARLALALLVLLCAGRAPAQVHVGPTLLTLTEKQTVGALTLTNRGGKSTTFEARMFRWKITDNQDDLAPTRELLVSPPVFTLAAGDSQTVRVALMRDFPQQTEAGYRVIFRELPSASQEGPVIGLQVALQISIPVFVLPTAALPAKLHWRAQVNDQGKLVVVAENRGGRHLKLTYLLPLATGNEPLAEPWQGLFYLLPGTRRQWDFAIATLPQTGDPVVLSIRTGRDEQDVRVQLE